MNKKRVGNPEETTSAEQKMTNERCCENKNINDDLILQEVTKKNKKLESVISYIKIELASLWQELSKKMDQLPDLEELMLPDEDLLLQEINNGV